MLGPAYYVDFVWRTMQTTCLGQAMLDHLSDAATADKDKNVKRA